ncbi:MAG: adenylyl-sulfate kinase [Verrucomicrobia bacterium]|nr:adenylyl-sulfate kinase [Verrucomicrobiota bacterium]
MDSQAVTEERLDRTLVPGLLDELEDDPLETKRNLRVVIVGHVDHGKSTLVGRLLHDSGSLPEGKFEQIQGVCRRRGMQFEWAFLLDALQAERDQNITIDVSQIWFRSARRNYVIIDAPGHKEFLKNMITGAATADAAVLLIAANEGVQEQSRRHAYLLSLLGVERVIVIVNKMDLVEYSDSVFEEIEQEYRSFLGKLGINPIAFIPVVARDGLNLVRKDPGDMSWYEGKTLLETLDDVPFAANGEDGPLRFAVQDVYRFDQRRILAGRVESGTLRVGDSIVFAPSQKVSTVATIENWNAPTQAAAAAGNSIGITLAEQIFVERGHLGSHEESKPIESNRFRARVFWMGSEPFTIGKRYRLKLLTQEVECQLSSIDRTIDATTLESSGSIRDSIQRNEVGEVTIHTRAPLVLDNFDRVNASGRFVIVDGTDLAGGGIIFGSRYLERKTIRSTNLSWSESSIRHRDGIERNNHCGMGVWMTGLSGSGKSTLARRLEKALFDRNHQVYVLDGDNIRHGLNANLTFSPEDRVENIRRVAEVAKLMADAGLVVITSFISPYRDDRERARELVVAGESDFVEVYISAPLAVCEERDPKSLYRKARLGEIKEFTGIDAPYEKPDDPDVVVATHQKDVEACVQQLLEYLLPRLQLDDTGYQI